MGDLLLPPRVRQEIAKAKWADQRAHQRALADRLLDFNDPVCVEWNPVIRDLDPRLRLGRGRPQAYEPGISVRPGYYHWVRDNDAAPLTITPITGPDGESWTEPDSGLLDRLRANDLQNPHVWRALIEAEEKAEADRERREDEALQRVNEETYERYVAGTRASVSMNRDMPWSQNASPGARRDARERRRP